MGVFLASQLIIVVDAGQRHAFNRSGQAEQLVITGRAVVIAVGFGYYEIGAGLFEFPVGLDGIVVVVEEEEGDGELGVIDEITLRVVPDQAAIVVL